MTAERAASPGLPVSPPATVGIVTVLYNSNSVLEGFFRSLALQVGDPFRLRLYVIDNSADDSGAVLCRRLAAEAGLEATVVFNNANAGVARGNNQGIELALADGCSHVLLSNNDVEFAAGTIARLVSALDASDASAATPKIHYFDDRRIWFVQGRFRPWTMQIDHLGIREADNGQFDAVKRCDYAPTCFMLCRSELFRQVGLMDEQYFVYYDDADFLWRMRAAGKWLQVVTEALVLHKVSTSTGGDFTPFSIYYANRNRIYFLRKHLGGLQRFAATCYLLATRAVQALMLPKPSAMKLWQGMRDGYGLRVPDSPTLPGGSRPRPPTDR